MVLQRKQKENSERKERPEHSRQGTSKGPEVRMNNRVLGLQNGGNGKWLAE